MTAPALAGLFAYPFVVDLAPDPIPISAPGAALRDFLNPIPHAVNGVFAFLVAHSNVATVLVG